MIVYWTTEEKLEKIEIRKWTIDERNAMMILRKIPMIGEDREKKIGTQVIKKVVKKKKNLVRDENATVEGKEIGVENETVEGKHSLKYGFYNRSGLLGYWKYLLGQIIIMLNVLTSKYYYCRQ